MLYLATASKEGIRTMIDHTTGAELMEVSDGVAGYLRDNPNERDRFFDLMAQKAALEAPNKDAQKTLLRLD